MSTDVTTTKRKPLTPTQRLKLFEAHKGLCGLCGAQIRAGEGWVDEHIIPLSLGGSNELNNRAPVHQNCAAAKTFGKDGDLAKAAKAKRQKMSFLGIRKEGPKIQSRGFQTSRKAPKISKTSVPPRNMYEEIK